MCERALLVCEKRLRVFVCGCLCEHKWIFCEERRNKEKEKEIILECLINTHMHMYS